MDLGEGHRIIPEIVPLPGHIGGRAMQLLFYLRTHIFIHRLCEHFVDFGARDTGAGEDIGGAIEVYPALPALYRSYQLKMEMGLSGHVLDDTGNFVDRGIIVDG